MRNSGWTAVDSLNTAPQAQNDSASSGWTAVDSLNNPPINSSSPYGMRQLAFPTNDIPSLKTIPAGIVKAGQQTLKMLGNLAGRADVFDPHAASQYSHLLSPITNYPISQKLGVPNTPENNLMTNTISLAAPLALGGLGDASEATAPLALGGLGDASEATAPLALGGLGDASEATEAPVMESDAGMSKSAPLLLSHSGLTDEQLPNAPANFSNIESQAKDASTIAEMKANYMRGKFGVPQSFQTELNSLTHGKSLGDFVHSLALKTKNKVSSMYEARNAYKEVIPQEFDNNKYDDFGNIVKKEPFALENKLNELLGPQKTFLIKKVGSRYWGNMLKKPDIENTFQLAKHLKSRSFGGSLPGIDRDDLYDTADQLEGIVHNELGRQDSIHGTNTAAPFGMANNAYKTQYMPFLSDSMAPTSNGLTPNIEAGELAKNIRTGMTKPSKYIYDENTGMARGEIPAEHVLARHLDSLDNLAAYKADQPLKNLTEGRSTLSPQQLVDHINKNVENGKVPFSHDLNTKIKQPLEDLVTRANNLNAASKLRDIDRQNYLANKQQLDKFEKNNRDEILESRENARKQQENARKQQEETELKRKHKIRSAVNTIAKHALKHKFGYALGTYELFKHLF